MKISTRTAILTVDGPEPAPYVVITLGAGTHPVYLRHSEAVELWEKLGRQLVEIAVELKQNSPESTIDKASHK